MTKSLQLINIAFISVLMVGLGLAMHYSRTGMISLSSHQEYAIGRSLPVKPAQAQISPPVFPPRVIDRALPLYPASALRDGVEGKVVLSLAVSESGNVSEASVISSSGNAELDNAAVKTALLWRFDPARRGPQAISSRYEIPIRFEVN